MVLIKVGDSIIFKLLEYTDIPNIVDNFYTKSETDELFAD